MSKEKRPQDASPKEKWPCWDVFWEIFCHVTFQPVPSWGSPPAVKGGDHRGPARSFFQLVAWSLKEFLRNPWDSKPQRGGCQSMAFKTTDEKPRKPPESQWEGKIHRVLKCILFYSGTHMQYRPMQCPFICPQNTLTSDPSFLNYFFFLEDQQIILLAISFKKNEAFWF